MLSESISIKEVAVSVCTRCIKRIHVLEYTEKKTGKANHLAYKDFTNDYKSDAVGSCAVFYGAEDYLIDWAIDRIVQANVEDAYRDTDYRALDGEQISAYDILAEARAYSMFSPKRVVVVRNYLPMFKKTADAGMDELMDFATELSASADDSPSILIFAIESINSGSLTSYGKQIIRSCKSYEFAKLDKGELISFVSKRVRAAGKMIANREMSHLIDVTGYFNRGSTYSLKQLDSDISKLTGACDGDTIDIGIIDEIMMGEGDKFVFDLVDALVAGKKGRALEIAETIIKEEDGAMAVLALLTRQFEIMYDALELSDRGMSMAQMSKSTGINEYRFKKAYTAAMGYSKNKIKSLLTDLYNTDRDIKRGDIDKDAALELFVIRAAK